VGPEGFFARSRDERARKRAETHQLDANLLSGLNVRA
jgi:hypothetical protein